MGKTILYDKYRKFANQVNRNNLSLLSGRYKFLNQKYKYIYKDILQKLSINRSDDIFDIGTGDGRIISHLSKKCKSATTIDSREIINKIPNKVKKITYLKGNIHEKGKKIKKRFNKILVYSVVQYFHNLEEVCRFINLCLKLLKDSGMILIGDIPNKDMDLRYQNTKNYQKQSRIFARKRMYNISELEKNFFFTKDKVKTINFSDKKLLFLLKKFNTLNCEAYILPQNKELPYSVKRVDLLIRKRS